MATNCSFSLSKTLKLAALKVNRMNTVLKLWKPKKLTIKERIMRKKRPKMVIFSFLINN
jgi:hypothetical protein